MDVRFRPIAEKSGRHFRNVSMLPPTLRSPRRAQDGAPSVVPVSGGGRSGGWATRPVIGRNWNETSASGKRRLNDRGDHLRLEIEAALERSIPIIPVLVDGVTMPSEEELPPSLARLAYRNGIEVRPDPDFHNDAERLLRGIEPLLK